MIKRKNEGVNVAFGHGNTAQATWQAFRERPRSNAMEIGIKGNETLEKVYIYFTKLQLIFHRRRWWTEGKYWCKRIKKRLGDVTIQSPEAIENNDQLREEEKEEEEKDEKWKGGDEEAALEFHGSNENERLTRW